MPALLIVNYKMDGPDAFVDRYAANVSRNGIFIVTRETHPVGTEVGFEIRTIDNSTLFKGRGTVRWVRAYDRAKKQLPGLGVQFSQLDSANRGLLEKMLKRQLPVPGQAALDSMLAGGTPTPAPVAPRAAVPAEIAEASIEERPEASIEERLEVAVEAEISETSIEKPPEPAIEADISEVSLRPPPVSPFARDVFPSAPAAATRPSTPAAMEARPSPSTFAADPPPPAMAPAEAITESVTLAPAPAPASPEASSRSRRKGVFALAAALLVVFGAIRIFKSEWLGVPQQQEGRVFNHPTPPVAAAPEVPPPAEVAPAPAQTAEPSAEPAEPVAGPAETTPAPADPIAAKTPDAPVDPTAPQTTAKTPDAPVEPPAPRTASKTPNAPAEPSAPQTASKTPDAPAEPPAPQTASKPPDAPVEPPAPQTASKTPDAPVAPPAPRTASKKTAPGKSPGSRLIARTPDVPVGRSTPLDSVDPNAPAQATSKPLPPMTGTEARVTDAPRTGDRAVASVTPPSAVQEKPDVKVAFRGAAAKGPDAKSPAAPTDTVSPDRSLEERVRKLVQLRNKEVQLCYDRVLKERPDIKGRVTLEMATDHTGKVGQIEILDNTTRDARIAGCLRQAFRGIQFPDVTEEATIQVPFQLTPDRMAEFGLQVPAQ